MSPPSAMTKDEYRAALQQLRLTQGGAAKLLGVDDRTSRRWANGERDIPPPAARFLRYLMLIGADVERVTQLLS